MQDLQYEISLILYLRLILVGVGCSRDIYIKRFKLFVYIVIDSVFK